MLMLTTVPLLPACDTLFLTVNWLSVHPDLHARSHQGAGLQLRLALLHADATLLAWQWRSPARADFDNKKLRVAVLQQQTLACSCPSMISDLVGSS